MKQLDEHDICGIFGKNIRKYRNRYSWSQEQLAEKIDVSATFLSNVETGKAWISPKTIAKLCNVLQLDTHELFAREDVMDGDTYDLMDRLVRDISNSVSATIEHTYKKYRKDTVSQ